MGIFEIHVLWGYFESCLIKGKTSEQRAQTKGGDTKPRMVTFLWGFTRVLVIVPFIRLQSEMMSY